VPVREKHILKVISNDFYSLCPKYNTIFTIKQQLFPYHISMGKMRFLSKVKVDPNGSALPFGESHTCPLLDYYKIWISIYFWPWCMIALEKGPFWVVRIWPLVFCGTRVVHVRYWLHISLFVQFNCLILKFRWITWLSADNRLQITATDRFSWFETGFRSP
jgi:hypothetical protein